MSAATALWARIALVTAVVLLVAALLEPSRPPRRLAWPVATTLGAGAGIALFVAITRRRPTLPVARSSAPVLLAKLGFLGLWATNEELLWRRLALGELLAAGGVPALLASTLGFALVHRARRRVHLVTGGAFGGIYLATGVLAASVAAHWIYNVLVGALVDREVRRAQGPP
jgi:membrane protease YdiL (CAAX protease family)